MNFIDVNLSCNMYRRIQHQREFPCLDQQWRLRHSCFHTYFRMSVGQFELLLAESGLHLRQRDHFRETTEPMQCAAVCLRLLLPCCCVFSSGVLQNELVSLNVSIKNRCKGITYHKSPQTQRVFCLQMCKFNLWWCF